MQRRAHDRHPIWLAVELAEGDGEPALAVSRDVSKAGLMVLTAGPYRVGALLRVTVRLPTDGAVSRTFEAEVVRCEPNRDDPEGMWHQRVALRLARPDDELEAWLDELEPPPSFRA